MRRTTRMATTLAAASLMLAGTAAVSAPSASATSKCSTNTKEFPTSGFNVDVTIKLCIDRWWGGPGGSYEYRRASAYVSWGDAGGNKWDNFDVQVRLENNDADVRTAWCDITSKLDNNSSGSTTCETTTVVNGSGNTADGYVSYNINDDGKGDYGWSLTGSPKL